MRETAKLTDDFSTPAYKAGLEILLLLAGGFEAAFSANGAIDLFDGAENCNWIQLLRLLGELSVSRNTKVEETAQIGNLWKTFLGHIDVKDIEKDLMGVLKVAQKISVANAKSGKSIVDYLDHKNNVGHDIVNRILKKHGAGHLVSSSSRSIEVFYDGSGKEYCAGSSQWTDVIRWGYQPVAHGVMGAVIAEFVFAHEYLSHLIPQNKYLDLTIREQWLVAALRGALREDKSIPHWKIRLWTPYRSALESQIVALARVAEPDASGVRYSGCEGAEEELRNMHMINPSLFWHLTIEILASKDDQDIAEQATRIARSLVYHGLPTLPTGKMLTIKELAEIVDP